MSAVRREYVPLYTILHVGNGSFWQAIALPDNTFDNTRTGVIQVTCHLNAVAQWRWIRMTKTAAKLQVLQGTRPSADESSRWAPVQ